jgi:S1-C subfamily serine protease
VATPDTVDFVHGDLLDLALVVIAAAFAVSGYRQGFIVGSLSFLGFLGGAVLGAEFGPGISRGLVGGQTQQDVVAVIILISAAIIGQFVASSIGTAVRSSMTGRSTTQLDSVGGAAVSVLSVLLIAWAIGSVLIASPFPLVDSQVNDSAVLQTMDRIMPQSAKTMFSDFRGLLSSGPFPQVFSDIGGAQLLSVPAPDQAVLQSPGFLAARSRVVKVYGTAPNCGQSGERIEGSGFVYSPDHVMTDAHVVAGVTEGPNGQPGGPTVTTIDGVTYESRVVFYDPQIDIAVLYVPGLNLTPLQFDTQGAAGDDAVVAGYPENNPFTADAARIGKVEDAEGPDIYQTGEVDRQIFEIRAVVEPGNSGGPLLSPDGEVYGVTFAAAVGESDTGFTLTASEVAADAQAGANATAQVSTQGCD